MEYKTIAIADEAAMGAFAERWAPVLGAAGLMVTLRGELGAGKTTLVRAILRALGVSGLVRSPTYTLVEPYDLEGRWAYHLDLYRVSDPEELEFLGVRDFDPAQDLIFVEWPEKAAGLLPCVDVAVEIGVADDVSRRLQLTGHSMRGAAALAQFK